MLKMLTTTLATLVLTGALAAQGQAPTVADFAGTWNIELMSHQIALVIEAGEGNTATATMMMMGRDIPLKGELTGRSIAFSGVKAEGAADNGGHVQQGGAGAKPIVVTLQEDGTLAGEMMTSQGPAKWTGEKLRTRKKPQP